MLKVVEEAVEQTVESSWLSLQVPIHTKTGNLHARYRSLVAPDLAQDHRIASVLAAHAGGVLFVAAVLFLRRVA